MWRRALLPSMSSEARLVVAATCYRAAPIKSTVARPLHRKRSTSSRPAKARLRAVAFILSSCPAPSPANKTSSPGLRPKRPPRLTSRRIGIHTSTAGGIHNAAERAYRLGCNTLQIFSSSPRQWAPYELSYPLCERDASPARQYDLKPLVDPHQLSGESRQHESVVPQEIHRSFSRRSRTRARGLRRLPRAAPRLISRSRSRSRTAANRRCHRRRHPRSRPRARPD